MKLVNRTCRDIFSRGAHRLVAYVHAVHFNAGRAAKAAAHGDGREAHFRGVEVAAILNLHAGFELREIEKVPSVYGQILDLLSVQNSLNARLLGVDSYSLLGHFNHRVRRAYLKTKVDTRNDAHFYDHALFDRLETRRFGANRIISRKERAGIICACRRGGDFESLTRVFIGDANLGAFYDRAAWVRDRSLNASGGGGALRTQRCHFPKTICSEYGEQD